MVINSTDICYRRVSFAVSRLYVLVFLTLGLSGCIILPYPTKVEPLPFDDEILTGIVPGESSKEAVIDLLGKPDLEGDESTIALYANHRRVAGLIGAAGNTAGTAPIRSKHILVISYDENDTVRFVNVFRHGLIGGGSEICASSGICIDPRIEQTDDEYRIVNATFYDSPERDADAKSLDIPSDRCAVYVYLDTNFWAGENIMVHADDQGNSAVQLDKTGYYVWHHDSSRLTLGASAPRSWPGRSDFEVDCQADQAYFIKAKLRWNWGEARDEIDFAVEKPARGRAAIRKRRLVLGPG